MIYEIYFISGMSGTVLLKKVLFDEKLTIHPLLLGGFLSATLSTIPKALGSLDKITGEKFSLVIEPYKKFFIVATVDKNFPHQMVILRNTLKEIGVKFQERFNKNINDPLTNLIIYKSFDTTVDESLIRFFKSWYLPNSDFALDRMFELVSYFSYRINPKYHKIIGNYIGQLVKSSSNTDGITSNIKATLGKYFKIDIKKKSTLKSDEEEIGLINKMMQMYSGELFGVQSPINPKIANHEVMNKKRIQNKKRPSPTRHSYDFEYVMAIKFDNCPNCRGLEGFSVRKPGCLFLVNFFRGFFGHKYLVLETKCHLQRKNRSPVIQYIPMGGTINAKMIDEGICEFQIFRYKTKSRNIILS